MEKNLDLMKKVKLHHNKNINIKEILHNLSFLTILLGMLKNAKKLIRALEKILKPNMKKELAFQGFVQITILLSEDSM